MGESPVNFRHFVYLCFREAIRSTWDKADFWATAIGIVLGVIAHFIPSWEHAVNNIAWEIPLACLATVGGTRLFLSPFLIYRKRDESAKQEIGQLRTELEQERDSTKQPDVALVWNWMEQERQANTIAGRTEKDILVHNRSEKYVYNVKIKPIELNQEMTFEHITEIAPGEQHLALARWDGRTSRTTNYVYFFDRTENGIVARSKGWWHKKLHNEGLSDVFLKIPMAVTYECDGRTWERTFDFNYDIGAESTFVMKAGRSVS